MIVCGGFCDYLWYRCASNGHYGNTPMSSLYANGRDFCQREGFVIQDRNCFDVHPSLASTTSGTVTLKTSGLFVMSFASFMLYILMYF